MRGSPKILDMELIGRSIASINSLYGRHSAYVHIILATKQDCFVFRYAEFFLILKAHLSRLETEVLLLS